MAAMNPQDETEEWYEAGAVDHYNLNRKLLRVGCRPAKRKLLACQQARRTGSVHISCEVTST